MKQKRTDTKTKQNQSSLMKHFRPCATTPVTERISQDEVNQLIMQYIVQEMRPLCTVEKPAFKDLVTGLTKGLGIVVISRKSLSLQIEKLSKTMKERMTELFRVQDFLCTTADVWSCNNKSYLGVTIHFIDDNSFERRSFFLACRRFKFEHTFDKIAQLLSQIHVDFDIDIEKLTHTVTDNAANFSKAFRCFPALNEVDFASISYQPVDDNDTDESLEVATFLFDSLTDYLDKNENDLMLPPQMRCCSHTLNLLATTDAKKAANQIVYKKHYTSAFSKAIAFWNLISRSTKAADVAEASCQTKFVLPVVTRWNSYYEAVNKLLAHKDMLRSLFDELKIPQFKSADIEFLTEYVSVMEPIAMALDILQAENDCYFGIVLPTLFAVETKLKKLSFLNYCKNLVEIMLAQLYVRFPSMSLEVSSSRWFILATISHPRYRVKYFPSHSVEKCKELFLKECDNVGKEHFGATENMNASTDSTDDFFSCLTEQNGEKKSQFSSENFSQL